MYSTFSILFICFIFGHFIRCAHNRMHIQKSSQKLCAAQLLLVFQHIFTDKILSFVTSPFPPFPMLLFWRTFEIFTQMLKFSSNLWINLPYFEHISTIWFFFISYITFVHCMICSAAKAFIGTKSVSHSQREFHHYRRHY